MNSVSWQRTIDQIILTGTVGDDRVLGITSITRGSGVSLISRALARTLANGRSRVLLVDLSAMPVAHSSQSSDSPLPESISDRIVASGQGYDTVGRGAECSDDETFIELPGLRQSLDAELSKYTHIVLDLPPILNDMPSRINPIAAGAMCDRVVLVTRLGTDKRSELLEALSMLDGANVKPAITLANEF